MGLFEGMYENINLIVERRNSGPVKSCTCLRQRRTIATLGYQQMCSCFL
jgi:hypothetical protein